MTNYNQRIDEILGLLNARMPQPKTINEAKSRVAMCHDAKQAITSLVKELVAEAKPEMKPYENSHEWYNASRKLDEFEQNLLKELEETSDE